MKEIMSTVRKNAGFLLLSANVILAIIAFVAYDPFALIQRGYGASPLVADGASYESDVREIRIKTPGQRGFQLSLTRLGQLPGQKLDRKTGPQYDWKLRVQETNGTTVEYRADLERVRELFHSLRQARRYYALRRSPEKDRDLELGKDERGNSVCPELTLVTQDGKEQTLYLGRASGGESYVRVGSENEVFLIQANLRTSAGAQELAYFRNRRVLPEGITATQIEALSADFPALNLKLSLAAAPKGGWELHGYARGPGETAAIERLLEDLLGLKALAFPLEVPKDIDRKFAIKISIFVKADAPLNQPVAKKAAREVKLEVLGKKDYSNYFVRNSEGTLFEVSSLSLGDLFEADEKLGGRAGRGLRMPEERVR